MKGIEQDDDLTMYPLSLYPPIIFLGWCPA